MKLNLENFLTTRYRIDLFKKIKYYAKIYFIHYKILQDKCRYYKNPINEAINQIRNANPYYFTDSIFPETYTCKDHLLNLEKAKMELVNNGVPYILVLEICNRVFHEDNPKGYKEYYFEHNDLGNFHVRDFII